MDHNVVLFFVLNPDPSPVHVSVFLESSISFGNFAKLACATGSSFPSYPRIDQMAFVQRKRAKSHPNGGQNCQIQRNQTHCNISFATLKSKDKICSSHCPILQEKQHQEIELLVKSCSVNQDASKQSQDVSLLQKLRQNKRFTFRAILTLMLWYNKTFTYNNSMDDLKFFFQFHFLHLLLWTCW